MPIPPVRETITVTESISTDAPAAVTSLPREEISAEAGVNIDDRLRSVPGFSLFRRSSSVVANPTTQGVSLRGIGSSGASRTLVLWDGIPENDPFGGWLYWDRFAPQELERVEISRGASTSAFGDLALGGAIALFSRPAGSPHYLVEYDAGNRATQELAAGASNGWRRVALSGFVRAFSTDGYFIVPRERRGRADTPANVEFTAANLRLDLYGASQRFFLRGDVLAEHRENGTVLQTNSTGLGSVAGNYALNRGREQLSVLGWHTREAFRAVFSSVAANRNSERLAYRQTVPSEGVGGAAYWRHDGGSWHALGGADVQRVEGRGTDRLFPSGLRVGGGSQLQHGVFGQFDVRSGPLQLFGGSRFENERVYPNAGLAVGRRGLRVRGSVYRAFRAPTLNELYREFRVGNVITQANAALHPETLFGAEAGLDWSGENTRASVSFFRNDLQNLITNVTLRATPNVIIRQRRNAAGALSHGMEASLRRRWGSWQGQGSWLYSDSRFSTGLRVPQVPRHQGSAELMFLRRRTQASVAVRSYAYQYEDDVNKFVLPGFATVNLAVDQTVIESLSLRAEVENLLDRQYLTGFSPTPTIGAPLLFRLGLRWSR